MRVCFRYFNFYLALMAVALLCASCKTDKSAKVFSALRVHLQAPQMSANSVTVSVIRSNPVLVTVARDPILTESDVYGARIIDAQGGFALQIGFNENAAMILEQYTAANSGK